MCHVITIAIPAPAALAARAAHAQRGMTIDPTRNPSALVAAGEGRLPLLVTAGGCSCAWYTPPSVPAPDDHRDHVARTRARYQRLGWSQAKIGRALASMQRPPRPDDGLHPVILDLLRELALAHARVGVWVHDFSGHVEREPYTIIRHEHWPLADLAARAASLAPDVLADITA